jgi:hypothetical protein
VWCFDHPYGGKGTTRRRCGAQPLARGPTSTCQDDPDAQCFDRNRSTVAAGIDVPPAPFQNRPTFQQTVELTKALPR